jgi:anti-anti-sigma regulatory factor
MDRGESCFVIDFSKTGFIDSSGLGVLISVLKRITTRGGNGSRCARNVAERTITPPSFTEHWASNPHA